MNDINKAFLANGKVFVGEPSAVEQLLEAYGTEYQEVKLVQVSATAAKLLVALRGKKKLEYNYGRKIYFSTPPLINSQISRRGNKISLG